MVKQEARFRYLLCSLIVQLLECMCMCSSVFCVAFALFLCMCLRLADVFKDFDNKGLAADLMEMLEPLGHDDSLKAQCHAERLVYNDDVCLMQSLSHAIV